jgi:hypothetical protein
MAGALFQHAGLDELDYTPGTVRTEMGDTLLASLFNRPNVLAAMPIGQFGGGGTGVGAAVQQLLHYWVEDRINPRQISDISGQASGVTTTMTVTAADGAVVDVGYFIQDTSQAQSSAELVMINGITVGSPNYTLNLLRSQLGTTGVSHAAAAVWQIVATPVQQNSGLGRDMSRAPGIKSNLIQTWRRDVNISSAMIALAQYGHVPGIKNQVAYQLSQRFTEMLIDMENSVIKGIGTQNNVNTDYQTLWGILSWFGAAAVNANATSVLFNAQGAAISDLLINNWVINVTLQGAEIPDVLMGSSYFIDRTARIYKDQLRLGQDELVRGYFVDAIRSSMGAKLIKLVMSNWIPYSLTSNTLNIAIALSLARIGLIPFLNQFCYFLSAPSFNDGDAMSVLAKFTIEPRNTGTDFGYAGQVLTNFQL